MNANWPVRCVCLGRVSAATLVWKRAQSANVTVIVKGSLEIVADAAMRLCDPLSVLTKDD